MKNTTAITSTQTNYTRDRKQSKCLLVKTQFAKRKGSKGMCSWWLEAQHLDPRYTGSEYAGLTIVILHLLNTNRWRWNLIFCLVALTSCTAENELTHIREKHSVWKAVTSHRAVLCLVWSIYLWNNLTQVKSKQKHTLSVLAWIKERHYIRWISWINQASGIPFVFHSLGCMLGEDLFVCAAPARHSTSCESEDTMEVSDGYFPVNWCDGGEWMGKQKSGQWHLADNSALA